MKGNTEKMAQAKLESSNNYKTEKLAQTKLPNTTFTWSVKNTYVNFSLGAEESN